MFSLLLYNLEPDRMLRSVASEVGRHCLLLYMTVSHGFVFRVC